MSYFSTNFPDEEYLKNLTAHLLSKHDEHADDLEKIIVLSNAAMNWIGDYLSANNVSWTLEELSIEKLYLTGTHPEWNQIIIEQCERSVEKFKQLLLSDPKVADLFSKVEFSEVPILVRFNDNQYKVLDGMHRVIACIRDNKTSIKAWVARTNGELKPDLEPHVLYDLFKAFARKGKEIKLEERDALIKVLKILRKSYANVDSLLKERFSIGWLPSSDLQNLIKEVLI